MKLFERIKRWFVRKPVVEAVQVVEPVIVEEVVVPEAVLEEPEKKEKKDKKKQHGHTNVFGGFGMP